MGLFGNKKKQEMAEDALLIKAQALIDQTKKGLAQVSLELILRLQLRDDITYLEKQMEKYRKKQGEKEKEALSDAICRLETTSGNILRDRI